MLIEAASDSRGKIHIATKVYEYFLRVGGALFPLLGVWYLHEYQSSLLCSVEHAFHNIAVFVAILISSFVSVVTWRCYRFSGEPFLRWLTLGFIGFTVIYAPHGLFTSISDTHMALFLLYGPTSRLVMAMLLFVGLLNYRRKEDSQIERDDHMRWWRWGAIFLVIDIGVALIAETSLLQLFTWRTWLEAGALVIALVGVVIVLLRHRSSPLMMTYAFSLTLFAQSSLAFLLAKPWNHQWWYAHVIFACGFFLLSYGVVRAFHTTGAFSTVFSVEELMSRLRIEKNHTDDALRQLQAANIELAKIASTDSLTGVSNRRHFLERVEVEYSRSRRNGSPLSLLELDIDHFKSVNDQYGHQVGDSVLRSFARSIMDMLRPHDIIGRIGGEEFMVLLPETSREAAAILAERIRATLEQADFAFEKGTIRITASIGVAEFGADGVTQDTVFRVVDRRLYQAKHGGRNRIVS